MKPKASPSDRMGKVFQKRLLRSVERARKTTPEEAHYFLMELLDEIANESWCDDCDTDAFWRVLDWPLRARNQARAAKVKGGAR